MTSREYSYPRNTNGHDRDENQRAEGRGLGDVEPLRDAGAEAIGPIQIERAERDAPHDHDRDQLERVVAEGGTSVTCIRWKRIA